MYIPEIIEVKEKLQDLKSKSVIAEWELPYENLLTRRSAAIFFVSVPDESADRLSQVWSELNNYENFSVRVNEEKKLSALKYRITFSKEEREKNQSSLAPVAQQAVS